MSLYVEGIYYNDLQSVVQLTQQWSAVNGKNESLVGVSMGTLVAQGALLICTPAQEKAPWPPGIGQSAGTQFACTHSGGVGTKFELMPGLRSGVVYNNNQKPAPS